jgi:hypothetical protein
MSVAVNPRHNIGLKIILIKRKLLTWFVKYDLS